MSKQTVYEAINAKLLELLAQGTCPWRRPWNSLKAAGGARPRNIEGNLYRGANWFTLGLLPYETPIFLTYKQAIAHHGQVRRGEHGHQVIFWKLLQITEENAEKLEDIGRKLPLLKAYTVFNISQCEGLKLPAIEPVASPIEFDPILEAEALWAGMPNRPSLGHGGDRACYSPSLDRIQMPARAAFTAAEGYYETLFHEMGHSTGHGSRLDRKEITGQIQFGSQDYSLEELVAELVAAYLCAESGIDQPTLENQASYLSSWIQKLSKEPRAFVTAAARAQKAADWILDRKATAAKPEEAA